MSNFRPLILAALALLAPTLAYAQSTPNFTPGFVPTVQQWNSYFGNKADTTNGVLTTPTINGATLSGTLSGNATINLGTGSIIANGGITTSGTATALNYYTPGATVVLSGSTEPKYASYLLENWAGTFSGSSPLSNTWIGDSSDDASMPSGRDELLIYGNYGGSNFSGSRVGVFMQMQLNTAITSGEASSLIGFGDVVTATANAGGAASGFGSTTFGLGALFGANPWCRLANGATYFNQCVGAELDGSIQTGASSSVFAVQQNVLTSDHATHGAVTDVMLSFEAQGGAGVGVRNLITAGRFDSGGQGGTSYSSPLDPNGYLFQVQPGATSVPADTVIIGAGGFDLNLFSATGIGATGGGFAWRSPGVQLLPAAAQIGNLGITAGTSGPVLTANYQEMVGTPSTITVATGGTDWNPNQLACDNYGDCVRVTESSGVVTAVAAVVSQGWQTAPPSNPVAFTGQTAPGTSLGTGLTLNLTWASAKTISFGTAGGASNGFEFVPSASGSIPRIAGVGVDASQAFQLEAAGTGGLQLGNTGKGISVAIGNAGGVPGGVDYLALLGSAGAGTDVAVISADGGDANVSLELRTQGAGTVDLMPGSSVTVFSASASVVSVVGAHIASTGTAPAVSGCGTSPSIASGSTDLKGIINVGSGTVTACTVTFATAYASTPVVVVEVNGTTAVASSVSGASTTGFTANFASSVGGGFIGYHVIQ